MVSNEAYTSHQRNPTIQRRILESSEKLVPFVRKTPVRTEMTPFTEIDLSVMGSKASRKNLTTSPLCSFSLRNLTALPICSFSLMRPSRTKRRSIPTPLTHQHSKLQPMPSLKIREPITITGNPFPNVVTRNSYQIIYLHGLRKLSNCDQRSLRSILLIHQTICKAESLMKFSPEPKYSPWVSGASYEEEDIPLGLLQPALSRN